MTIDITLDPRSINHAISEIEKIIENIENGVTEFVDIACKDGAEEANAAYGGMATAWGVMDISLEGEAEGHIGVGASTEDQAIIAEFGAGYGTMEDHPFAGKAPVPIKVASYSQAQYPYGLFYITNDLYGEPYGYWFFGGKVYHEVPARHGLLNASNYLKMNGTRIAREVIRL